MSELTLAQLERMVAKRRSSLESLQKKRRNLLKELERLDKQIASLQGPRGNARPGTYAQRARNEKSLQTVVAEILTKSKKGLTLRALAERVLESGYKTNSNNFQNVLYQCLYNSKRFEHDPSTGNYVIVETA